MNRSKISHSMKLQQNSIYTASVYALLLLFKCLLFIYLISPELIDFPKDLLAPYNIRILLINFFFCGIISAFVFLVSNKGWTILVAILLDIWLIGNLLYFRSYHDLLNSWSLINISNMNGIWESILPFMLVKDLLFPLITLLWMAFLMFVKHYFPTSKRSIKLFLFSLWIAGFGFLPTAYVSYQIAQPINPFSNYFKEASTGRIWYATTFSPIAHFINESKNLVIQLVSKPEVPHINPHDVAPFLNIGDQPTSSQANLVIIFFESFESWIINQQIDGQEITPNINRLIQEESTAYFPNVVPQIRNGMSSDAQLIVNTGLLPIYDGAVSMRFYANRFPSIADALQSNSRKIFIPTPASAWNQGQMTQALHYTSLFAEPISDFTMMRKVAHEMQTTHSPFCFFVTTMASHSPFTEYSDSSNLKIASKLPSDLSNYIKSVNYTDQCIGYLVNQLFADSLLKKNTTIVITGDHTIFHQEKRTNYIDLLQKQSIPINQQACVPLMIYSADKITPTTCLDTIYQMDIYPTLLNVMHCENYVWKGFGINVFDETLKERPISPEKANELSDKLIRSNYFNGLHDGVPCKVAR